MRVLRLSLGTSIGVAAFVIAVVSFAELTGRGRDMAFYITVCAMFPLVRMHVESVKSLIEQGTSEGEK